MSRSLKKGPNLDERLLKKIARAKQGGGKKEAIKTWSRACQISPEFVGVTLAIHNGRNFTSVYITENMVGHRLGEFAPTRTFRSHGAHTQRSISKT